MSQLIKIIDEFTNDYKSVTKKNLDSLPIGNKSPKQITDISQSFPKNSIVRVPNDSQIILVVFAEKSIYSVQPH